MARIAVSILMVFVLSGCATTMTGRKQLVLFKESQMNKMGAASFTQLKESTPIHKTPVVNEYVICVANAITAVLDSKKVKEWEVVVFEEESVNAFALPGGKIGVHTGILRVATTSDQLAAIIGHEVAHVLLRHGNERVSQNVLAGVLLESTAVALGAADPRKRNAIMGSLGVGAQVGVLLPFSRKHESEADELGQLFMAKAGFDPAEAVTLWQNMSKAAGGSAPPEFLSTHPASSTRIQRLRKNLPKVQPEYEKAKAEGRVPQCTPAVPPKAKATKTSKEK